MPTARSYSHSHTETNRVKVPLILEPLRHRDFRLLWTGQTVSIFGNFVFGVALPFQFFSLGATPAQLGAGFAIATATQLVLLLYGGVIVDRVPRRQVILTSDLLSAVVVTAIGALSVSGALRIEHLYGAAVFFGASAAFFMPAIGAIIPELVPAPILVQGNALRGMSRQGARIVGPAIGGLIVVSAGPGWAFVFDGLTFLISFAALLATRRPATEVRARRSMFAEIREGLAFTFSLPWLWITIALFAFINVAYSGPLSVGLPVLVRDVMHADATVYGLLTAAAGAGEIVGGMFVGQVRIHRTGIAMYVFSIIGALSIAGFGFFPVLPFPFVCAAGIGFSLAGFGTLWDTAVQRNVPRELLGRVGSVDSFGSFLMGPIAPVVAGLLIQAYGPAPLFIAGGAMATALSVSALLVPSIRELRA